MIVVIVINNQLLVISELEGASELALYRLQLLQGLGERCYKRIQWSRLLQGVGKGCYKRIQCSQLLQGLGKRCYKKIQWLLLLQGMGERCYKRMYSGHSCYKEWVKVVVKGYSGSSHYSALKNVFTTLGVI